MPYIYKTDLFEYTTNIFDAENEAEMLNVPVEDICEVVFDDLLLDLDTFNNIVATNGDGVMNTSEDGKSLLMECYGILFVFNKDANMLYFKNIEDAEKFFSSLKYSLNYGFDYGVTEVEPVEEPPSVIDIREGLSRADKQSEFKYNLVQNYLSSRFTNSQRRKLAEAIQKGASANQLYSLMFPLDEDIEDGDFFDEQEIEEPIIHDGDNIMHVFDEVIDQFNAESSDITLFVVEDEDTEGIRLLVVPQDDDSIKEVTLGIDDLPTEVTDEDVVEKLRAAIEDKLVDATALAEVDDSLFESFIQPEYLTESWDDNLGDYSLFDVVRLMHETICYINDERAYMRWIYVMPDSPTIDDFYDFADDPVELQELKDFFIELVEDYGNSGLVDPSDEVLEFIDAANLMEYFV